MMFKMGWKCWEPLGIRASGIVEPIVINGQTNRNGLGYMITSRDKDLVENEFVSILQYKMELGDDSVYMETNLVNSVFDDETDHEREEIMIKSEIEIKVFDVAINCLIDSGSEITCISEDFWLRLRAIKEDIPLMPVKPIQIKGAVGQKSYKVQQIVMLPLEIMGNIIETGFLIVPKLIRPMIIGFNWMLQYKAAINLQDDKRCLLIETKNGILRVNLINEAKRTVELNVAQCDHLEINGTKIKTGGTLETKDVKRLEQLLQEHLALFTTELGRANCYQHEIRLVEHPPIIKYSYPIPYAYRAKLEEKLQEMTDMGIISRSTTPYSSPLTFTLKKDKSIRVLLDAREINKYMIAETEKPPMQIDVLNSFHGAKYITIIDLNNAYFQIPLTDESKKYTGFTYNGKSYVYNVLPQGLKTSVGSFSRAMDIILGPDVREFCVNYLDDLAIITSGSLEMHLEHIHMVLGRLKQAGMTCNLGKCEFLCKQVKMLGYIISTEGITTDPDKVRSIKEFPTPTKVKQVRAFLGLCNFYRKFIPNYSLYIVPLCKLLKKGVKWHWGSEEQEAFPKIKDQFINTIALHHPDFSKPYYLQTDCSGLGLAGVLYQIGDGEEIKVLGFHSKALKGPELKWTVTEQEFYAVISCLKKFETYLRGSSVIIKTDHKALAFVQNLKLYNSRVTRWILYLEQFDYTVEHIRGKENVVADTLSRYLPNSTSIQEEKDRCPEILYTEKQENRLLIKKLQQIATFQDQDDFIKSIKCKTSKNRITTKCVVENDIVYFVRGNDHPKVLLPSNLVEDVVTQVHIEMGHQGAYKITKYLRQRFYWIQLKRDVKRILKTCHICQLSKSNNVNYVGPCKAIVREDIGDLVMADIYGPLPKGKFGASYILVIQDSFSKYVKFYDLKKASARAIIGKIKMYLKIIKAKSIMTDNGSQFISDLWKSSLSELGIKVLYTTVRNPRPNITERVNRELGRLFRTYCHASHNSWATLLPVLEKLYNNTHHTSTGFTPNEILFGDSTNLTIDANLPLTRKKLDVSKIREQVRENLVKNSILRSSKFDKRHKLINFQIGDLVKIRKCNRSVAQKKVTKKFSLLYEGPYKITNVPFPNVYTLEDLTGKARGNFNAIHLTRYYL